MPTPHTLHRRQLLSWAAALGLGSMGLAGCSSQRQDAAKTTGGAFLNVSYDPTRELYQAVNQAFAATAEGSVLAGKAISQSHGGSGKQALSVLNGLKADVVTLALAPDIDILAEQGQLLPKDWQKRLPHNSTPFTSTIVFLVRKGNPKGIKDWADLVRADVQTITPNPKTSGGARWNYLAAWGYVQQATGSAQEAEAYMRQLFQQVPVLDTGARAALISFTQRQLGDVLLAWENEAYLALQESGEKAEFEIVVPSMSILAEPPVAWLDKNVQERGTQQLAQQYLQFLFTPEVQKLGAQHHFRPVDAQVQAFVSQQFKAVQLFSVDAQFGGWKQAMQTHFADGGSYDRVFAARGKS